MKYCIQQQKQGPNQKSILSLAASINSEYQCKQCQQKFHKKSHVYRHIREKHENQRIYKCTHENCNKEFKRGSHLKRHMISHTHQKPFKCDKCIMSFGYKHHLDRHFKLIHMKVLFKCNECSEEFIKKRSLHKHEKQHEKKRKKEMNKKKNLDKTLEIEENVDKIENPQIFEDEDEGEAEVIFRCSEVGCLSAFRQQHSLKKHLKNVHKVEV